MSQYKMQKIQIAVFDELWKQNKEPPNGEIEERTVMVDLEAQEECLLEARIAAWLESLPVELIDRLG